MTKRPDFAIIMPPNTLKLKAERPGGITRGEAVDIAASVIARTAVDYRAITAQDVTELEALSAGIWPADAAGTAQRRRFFRKAHDLWALGETFGYPLITDIAGSLCAYLGAVGDAGALDRTVVLLHLQGLRMIVVGGIKGTGGTAEREMVEGLRKAVAKTVG